MSLQYVFKSSIGFMYFVASEKGLQGIYWKKQPVQSIETLNGDLAAVQVLSSAVKQMSEFLKGQRRDFDLSYDIKGTEFQKRVWKQLSQIPYGETVSYSQIAKSMRQEKAVRAVGTANGRNPLSIIVPCHRVIAADGSLGGYAGGLAVKSKLLELERRTK